MFSAFVVLPAFVRLMLLFPLLLFLFPLFVASTEMFAMIVILIPAVNLVLIITVLAHPLQLMLAEAWRQIPVAYDSPWAVTMKRPVPATITEEVIGVPGIEQVVRQPHRHEKAQCPGENELRIILNPKHRWRSLIPRFMDNDWRGLIAKMDIQIDSNIASVGT